MVYAGPIFWDIKDAKEVMSFYRDFLPKASDKLCPFLGLKTVPSTPPFPQEIWGRRICRRHLLLQGPQADGEKAMKPLRDATPKPIFDFMGRGAVHDDPKPV